MSTMSPVEALRLLVEEELERVEFRPYVMLSNIRKDSAFQTSIEWNVSLGGAVSSGRATTADVASSADAADETKRAKLSIGDRVLGHHFAILRTAIEEAKNAGVGALRALFMEHIERAFEVIFTDLSAVLYNGTGNAASHGVTGITAAMAAAAYAGIATADYAEWDSTVSANGGTNRAITKKILDDHLVLLKRRGVMPTAIYTTPELIMKYEDLFNAERSLTVNQINGIADVGFSGHAYRRIPLIEDTQAPDNTLNFLDFSKLKLFTSRLTDVVNDGRVVSATTRMMPQMGLNFRVAELTNRNPDLLEMEISLLPQLQIRQPKSISAIQDITQ